MGIVVIGGFNNCAKDIDENKLAQQSLSAPELSLSVASIQVEAGQSTALNVSGGVAPYTFEITPAANGSVDSSSYFLASLTGVTTIKVMDSSGNVKELSVVVVAPPPPPPAGCTTPFGSPLVHNAAMVAWNVAVGTCTSETRVCVNGNLSGSFIHASCRAPLPCTTPWNTTIASGATVRAYSTTYSTSCPSQLRTCNDGVLSGTATYRYASCYLNDN